jgi:hypothetical protein
VSKSPYPQPREDADNIAFLAAWRDGELLIQHCNGCGKSVFYPRPICPHCWSDRLEHRRASGRGEVVAYSHVHRPNDPAFNDEVPIVLAEVALAEGALILARLIDYDAAKVRSGLAVVLPPQEVCARYPLTVFHLVDASRARTTHRTPNARSGSCRKLKPSGSGSLLPYHHIGCIGLSGEGHRLTRQHPSG